MNRQDSLCRALFPNSISSVYPLFLGGFQLDLMVKIIGVIIIVLKKPSQSHSSFKCVQMDVMDVMVVRKGRALETDLYCKPTDTHQYLQRASCHPWHTKKAIPYGQALRIRRICSDDGKF